MINSLITLEAQAQQKLDILGEIFHRNTWLTSEELSDKFQLPISKIHKLLLDLQSDILALFKDSSRFLVVKGRGVFLQLDDLVELENLQQFIIENTLTFKIFNSIAMRSNTSIQLLMTENYVSESSIRKKISEINKYFLEIDQNNPIKIVSRKGYFHLSGAEASIHLFLENVYWQVYRGRSWPFETVQKEKIFQLINNSTEGKRGRVKPIIFIQLAYIIAIRIIRSNNGKKISLRKDLDEYMPILEDVDEIDLYMKTLIKLGLTKEESIFLLLEFFVKVQLFRQFDEDDIHYAEFSDKTKAGMITKTITDIHFSIYGEYSELDQKKMCHFSFLVNLYADLFENIHYDSNTTILYEEFTLYYPNLTQRIAQLLTELYERTKIKFLLDSPYLISNYMVVFSHFQNIVAYEEEVIIYLETDLNKLLERKLISYIEDSFGRLFNLKIYVDIQKVIEEKKEYDLLISNGVVQTLTQHFKNKPYLVVPKRLRMKEYQQMYLLFLDCTHKKQKQKNAAQLSKYSFQYFVENISVFPSMESDGNE